MTREPKTSAQPVPNVVYVMWCSYLERMNQLGTIRSVFLAHNAPIVKRRSSREAKRVNVSNASSHPRKKIAAFAVTGSCSLTKEARLMEFVLNAGPAYYVSSR